MSYLVLALGAVLALGGAVALFTSYGIILVERGWAGVIAGTTALASGVVTIALGLILHRLASVHALLRSTLPGLPSAPSLAEDGTATSSAAELPHYVPKAALPLEPPASAQAGGSPASGLRSWPQRQTPRSAHTSGRGSFKPRGTTLPSPPRTREPAPASPPPPFSPPDLSSQTGAAPDGGSELSLEAGLPATAVSDINAGRNMLPQSGAAEAATAEDPREGMPNEPKPVQTADGDETLAQPLAAETPIEPGEPREQPSPHGSPAAAVVIETILQGEGRAAYRPAPEASKDDAEMPLPEAPEETSPRPPAAPSTAQGGAHPAATELGNVVSGNDAFSGAALAIVGRYESQGTSYIMYADGSIEARTDHAVIHFRSLDELKSFLDSQAHIVKE